MSACPRFVSRAFRHTSIWVRTDRIKKPEDLKGKKVGAAGISAHRQCLGARDPGRRPRREAVGHPLDPRRHRGCRPAGEDLDQAAAEREAGGRAARQDRARQLLAEGAIDGFIAPRPPSLPKNTPNVGWLFPDPTAAAKDYFKRTGIFPIMHLVGVRRTLAEQHPWLPGAVLQGLRAGQGDSA